MIKADTAIGKISDILREASLDEDVKLEKIYEIIDDVEDNTSLKPHSLNCMTISDSSSYVVVQAGSACGYRSPRTTER